MTIILSDINKKFDNYQVLNNINCKIENGELIALLGPSGSGKTTLLRIIAGLEPSDSGEILINGLNITNLSIKERNIGFVFQHYALFNHMTIFDNIAFGLKIKPRSERMSNNQIKDKVDSLLELVHIKRLANYYPKQISGGQKQRAALARALAVEPKILLLDEPFGALDSKVRKQLRKWIRQFHKDTNLTSIFVTHDQEEAMEIADRIIVMNNGKIEQIGTPEEVYNNPRNSFIYDFLGNFNSFAGEVQFNEKNYPIVTQKQPSRIISNLLKLKIFSRFIKKDSIIMNDFNQTSNIQSFSRPHNMDVLKETDDPKYVTTKLVHINPAGPMVKLELEKENGDLIYAEISHKHYNRLDLKKGDKLFTYPREATLFPSE